MPSTMRVKEPPAKTQPRTEDKISQKEVSPSEHTSKTINLKKALDRPKNLGFSSPCTLHQPGSDEGICAWGVGIRRAERDCSVL